MTPEEAGDLFGYLALAAGISGIIAAKTAAKNGLKTLLVDEKPNLGGSEIYQNSEYFKINNQTSGSWLEKEINEIVNKFYKSFNLVSLSLIIFSTAPN